MKNSLSDFRSAGCLMGEMSEPSDAELLRNYAERRNEAAFRELVTRHADLVYSAALRQVDSPDLAGDVAQTVFADLARKARSVAGQLAEGASLVGWLYCGTRFAALNQLRADRRRLTHERQAMEQLLTNSEPAPDWERIRPLLDEAMASLGDEDRDAVLLRYFKRQEFRAVGGALGISDDAAQKRVSRAVERLREFFAKRGVTLTGAAIAGAVSANAIQAVPVGLAVKISAAAILAGTTVATTTAIVMTTLQKTIIGATLAVAAAGGIYQARQTATARAEVQALKQGQTPLAEKIQQLTRDRDDATRQLAGLRDENERLNRNTTELMRLRSEATRLQQELRKLGPKAASGEGTGVASSSVPSAQQPAQFVFVGGEVLAPGRKVWSESMKLTDAIRMSEMLTSFAGKKVTIKDSSGNRKEYDLREIVSGKGEDPMLKPGDYVLVPRSENPLSPPDPATQIHMSGAVVLPSHWPWTNGLKLTDAISMVGGLTKYADGRVQINHVDSGTSDTYNLQDIQSGRAVNPALKSGDDIHLQPERPPSK